MSIRLTAEDIAIMDRFDWVPYDSEKDQPVSQYKRAEYSLFLCQAGNRSNYPLAHIAMRDYYAFK